MSKRAKGRRLHSDLIGLTEDQLNELRDAAQGRERRRIEQHMKAMGFRNRRKRRK
jgi:hypothetical protein